MLETFFITDSQTQADVSNSDSYHSADVHLSFSPRLPASSYDTSTVISPSNAPKQVDFCQTSFQNRSTAHCLPAVSNKSSSHHKLEYHKTTLLYLTGIKPRQKEKKEKFKFLWKNKVKPDEDWHTNRTVKSSLKRQSVNSLRKTKSNHVKLKAPGHSKRRSLDLIQKGADNSTSPKAGGLLKSHKIGQSNLETVRLNKKEKVKFAKEEKINSEEARKDVERVIHRFKAAVKSKNAKNKYQIESLSRHRKPSKTAVRYKKRKLSIGSNDNYILEDLNGYNTNKTRRVSFGIGSPEKSTLLDTTQSAGADQQVGIHTAYEDLEDCEVI